MPETAAPAEREIRCECAESVMAVDLSDMPLPEFRERVKRWANSFDPELRPVAFVLGNAVDRRTSVASYRQETLLRKMQEALDVQGNGDVAMGISTLRGRLRTMRQAGVTESLGQPRKVVTNFAGVQHFQALALRTFVNFTKVIVGGKVVPHDFMSPIADDRSGRDQVSNSDTSADTSPDSIQLRSSVNQVSKEDLPAAGRPSAIPGEDPRTPLPARSDQPQASAPEEEVPGWWTEALDEFARALERLYGTPVRRSTFRSKFLHLIDYFEDEDDLAESVRDFIAARGDRMSPGNEVRYIIGAFAGWVTENLVSLTEWNSPEYQAGLLFHDAQEAGLITPHGSVFQFDKPDGEVVRHSEAEWLELLRDQEKADRMRALLEGKGD